MKSGGVVPVHRAQGGQFDVLDGLPGARSVRSVDQFGPVVAVDGLGQGVDAPISVKRLILRLLQPRGVGA